MKKSLMIILVVFMLCGCQTIDKSMSIEPIELPDDEANLLSGIGGRLYEMNIDDSIKMIKITGTRYVQGKVCSRRRAPCLH